MTDHIGTKTHAPSSSRPSVLRLAGALALSAVVTGCSVFGAPAAEEPPFSVTRQDGAIEIRDYAELVVVSTTVEADSRDSAVGQGFSRLFDYITGANAGSRDIAMTAPVIVADGEVALSVEGAEIAMTAPVLVEESAGKAWTTVFVLPEAMTLDTAPLPSDPTVSLGTIPGRRVATIRFSGFFSDSNIAEAEAELRAWLEAEQIAHRGDFTSAGYNPPWTLPWLRRNEVIVTLE
ncbi:MAG: heme-binding protein [Pseudomonadota bacterium]